MFIPCADNIFPTMIVVKISEKIEYNVEKLQKGFEVSENIPKVIITGHGKQ